MRALLVGLTLLLPLGCEAAPRVEPSHGDDEAVLEAAYRWQIRDLQTRDQAAEVWFVSDAQGQDPDDAFLARFRDLARPVKKRSASAYRADAMVIDRESGTLGRILRVHAIERKPDGTVEVAVEAYAAPEGADGATLILSPSGAGYIVREVRGRWIS